MGRSGIEKDWRSRQMKEYKWSASTYMALKKEKNWVGIMRKSEKGVERVRGDGIAGRSESDGVSEVCRSSEHMKH